MDQEFWNRCWHKNEIGFHEALPNDLLVSYADALYLKSGDRLLLPLCGKTRDIGWLVAQGYRVVGVELNEKAVLQLFDELSITPDKQFINADLNCYHSSAVSIYQGDIFKLTVEQLGSVDAVYDRAAFVALPDAMRQRYSRHLLQLCAAAKQLLIVFEYDQDQLSGPPFSISEAEIKRHYLANYNISQLHSREVSGGLKGKCSATEQAWLLTPHDHEK